MSNAREPEQTDLNNPDNKHDDDTDNGPDNNPDNDPGNNPGNVTGKRKVLSMTSKNILLLELLKAMDENKIIDQRRQTRSNIVTHHIVNSLKQTITDLAQENKMLTDTLEKYRDLYYSHVPSRHRKGNV
jgi:hypothetical protein